MDGWMDGRVFERLDGWKGVELHIDKHRREPETLQTLEGDQQLQSCQTISIRSS